MEQDFKNQEIHTTPERLVEKYQKDSMEIKEINDLKKNFNDNQNFISNLAEKENLISPVTSQLPEQVEASMQEAQHMIESKQQEFSEQKARAQKNYDDFKEDNKVNDYGKKVKDVFKTLSEIPFYSSGLNNKKIKKIETDTKETSEGN